MYLDMRLMAGDQTWADGSFPLGGTKRATVESLVAFYSDGTKAKGNYVRKCIDRLKAAGVVRVTAKGVIFLSTFMDEQDLGNPEAVRKREQAAEKLEFLVEQAITLLKGLFERTGAHSLSYEMIKDHLAGQIVKPDGTGIRRSTGEKLVSNLKKRGALLFDEAGLGTLASLATPPETGAESGAVGVGSWPKYSGSRNIPVELEPELEPEGKPTVSSIDPIGTRAPSSGEEDPTCASEIEGGVASEARWRIPVADRGGGADFAPSSGVMLVEDAWTVRDPLQAAEQFLSNQPGWTEKQAEGKPPSKFAIRSRWRDLRKAVGPKEADAVWRRALFDILEDFYDGQSWRSWTAGFMSKVQIAREVNESLKNVGISE